MSTDANPPVLPQSSDPGSAARLLERFRDCADARFHVVSLEDGNFVLQAHGTVESCITKLKTLIGKDVHVFVFCGYHLRISRPPHPFLMAPGGQNFALFDLPQLLEPQDDGYLGGEIPITNLPEQQGARMRRRIELDMPGTPRPVDTGETPLFPPDAETEEHADDDEGI